MASAEYVWLILSEPQCQCATPINISYRLNSVRNLGAGDTNCLLKVWYLSPAHEAAMMIFFENSKKEEKENQPEVFAGKIP